MYFTLFILTFDIGIALGIITNIRITISVMPWVGTLFPIDSHTRGYSRMAIDITYMECEFRGIDPMITVTIYTSSLCPLCHQSKRLLDSKGVRYREIDLTSRPELRLEMRMRSRGQDKLPQVFIGDQHVGGWDELFHLEEGGTLDDLLLGPPTLPPPTTQWRGVRLDR